MTHMDIGPKGFLPCSPSPSPAATPNAAVQLKIIEKISHFSSQQAAPLQLLPRELVALTVGGTPHRVFCLAKAFCLFVIICAMQRLSLIMENSAMTAALLLQR